MFQHYLSAGFFCGIAASLSKYGLRSSSGPFDWCFSDLSGVVHFLETEFSDFLNSDNLEVIEGKEKEFLDTLHGIHFNHDIYTSFTEDFDSICAKYQRRITKYLHHLSEGACLIRVVRDEEELEYLYENVSHINDIVKKYNPNNEIIYLLLNWMEIPDNFPAKIFPLQIDVYKGTNYDILRTLFDTNQELIDYCILNYDSKKREKNLAFDIQKEYVRLKEKVAGLEEARIFWKSNAQKLEKDTAFLKTKVAELEEDRDFWKNNAQKLKKDTAFLKTKAAGLEEGRDFWKNNAQKLEKDTAFLKTKVAELGETLTDYQSSFLVRFSYRIHLFFLKLKNV